MPRTVSTSEAKNQLSAMIAWAEHHDEGVIVENHGRPRVVIISYTEYQRMRELRERERRRDLLSGLRALRSEVRAPNQDLTDDTALALADRFVREVIEEMTDAGAIRFEDDRRP